MFNDNHLPSRRTDTCCRRGALLPAGEQPRLLSFKAKLEALSRALPLLREAEQLGAQRGDAENELATAGAADSGEAAELRQELAEIDAELAEHEVSARTPIVKKIQ